MKATPLRCPYCGGRLRVELAWEGPAYLQSQVVDGFECSDWKCGATWNKDGEPDWAPSQVVE